MSNFTFSESQPPKRSFRKRELYRLLLARSDITAALEACRLFRSQVDKLGHPLYYPLFAAIVVCYARPFTKNRPLGPLPNKWATFAHPMAQKTHDQILDARHQLIAHSDIDARGAMIVPPGFVVGRDEGKELVSDEVAVQTTVDYFPLSFFRVNAWRVIHDLGSRLNEAIEPVVDELYQGMELPARPFTIRIDDEGL